MGLMFPKPQPRAVSKHRKRVEEEANLREVTKQVHARDGRRCRVCGRRCDPNAVDLLARAHLHHIAYRSAGGQDTTDNLVTLCAFCHAEEHAHTLKVDGNADTGIEVWRLGDEGWHMLKREVRCGEVERD